MLKGEDKSHARAALPVPPLASSRNSKQTIKSTISLLVFPSDGEQWLNTVPNPPVMPPQRKKNKKQKKKNQSAKGTLAPVLCVHVCGCVGVCMCAVTLQGHTRNTVSGSSEVSPGATCHPLSRKGGGDPTRSESLR